MKTYKTNIELISLVREKTNYKRAKLRTSENAADYARQFFSDDLTIYESFFMIMLNNSNNTTGYVKISQGGIVGTLVDVRIVSKYAIESLAVGVILVHNHPSGTLKPSQADIQITKKIKDALALHDTKVIDHIILTENHYFSFADENMI